MADVTVSQLAKTVGASVDRLLAQMKEAGLSHSSAEQLVSDEDKQRLLTHLKSSHGANSAAPKRITLKRRTIGTVKQSGAQGKKTVSVEVRKKRTYIKKDEPVESPDAEEPLPEVEIEDVALLEEADSPEVALETSGSSVASGDSTETAGDSATTKRVDPFDVEELRRRAAAKRKEQEVEQKARRTAILKSKAEEEARQKAEEAARLAKEAREKAAGPKHLRGTSTPGTDSDDEPK